MSTRFEELSQSGNSIGVVCDARRNQAYVENLYSVPLGAMVLFSNDEIGTIKSVDHDVAVVDLLTCETIPIGTQAIMSDPELKIRVSEMVLGRIVDPLMRPLDSKGPLLSATTMRVFESAPTFSDREKFTSQMTTGVTVVDTLFPIVKGQRIALLGDTKTGKTNFAIQTAANQVRQGSIAVYVVVAKRQSDVEHIVHQLSSLGVMDNVVLVVSDSFSPLPLSFLAPYSGCAVGEYFWQRDKDVVVIYDDLYSHAKIYREMSLLHGASPGRESFPGDMFYAHSSLLERAGLLSANHKSLTALPIVTTSNNDITSYLSTSLISITDGQIVFDVDELNGGAKPPIHTGLSVSRVGGRAQSARHRNLAQETFTAMAAYRQAAEFAHFGQELPEQYERDLRIGERLRQIFRQENTESYTLEEQQLMLSKVFLHPGSDIDVTQMKAAAHANAQAAAQEQSSKDFAYKLGEESQVPHVSEP